MTIDYLARKRIHEETTKKNLRSQQAQRNWSIPAPDWRAMRDEVKKELDKFMQAEALGTRLERINAGNDFTSKREAMRAHIEAGVISEHAAAVKNLEESGQKVEREKAAITNSWDSGKLSQELQVYSTRIIAAAQDGNLKALSETFEEAKNSQDKYKVRAAAMAIQTHGSKLPANVQNEHGLEGRMIINRMKNEAARELEAQNTSPGLEAALEGVTNAIAAAKAARGEIMQTAEVFGELAPNATIIHNSNLQRELNHVKIYPNGSFETFIDEV